jgi:hypothetical protein
MALLWPFLPMAPISFMSHDREECSGYTCGRWMVSSPRPSPVPKEPSTPSSLLTANGWAFSRAER